MYFLSNWITIVFCWGGLGVIIYILLKLKSKEQLTAKVDIHSLRYALYILTVFVILNAISTTDYIMLKFHPPLSYICQFVTKFLMGLLFILFLWKLWKAFIFK